MSEVAAKARDWLAELQALVEADDVEGFRGHAVAAVKARPDQLEDVCRITGEYLGEEWVAWLRAATADVAKPEPFIEQKVIRPGVAAAERDRARLNQEMGAQPEAMAQSQPIPMLIPQSQPKPEPKAKPGRRSWTEVIVPNGASELGALTYVPGVVGDIVEWIEYGNRRSSRIMALGAAMPTIGTIIGAFIDGPTGSSTNLFSIILAMSAGGKDWPFKACAILMRAVGAKNFLGPTEFASQPGLIKLLKRQPVMICFVDEYGDLLRQINNSQGNQYVAALTGLFKKLYNAREVIITAEKAGAGEENESTVLDDLCVSLACSATPESFFGALSRRDLESGFANRLWILPGFDGYRRPPERSVPEDAAVPPKKLVAAIKALHPGLGKSILDAVCPKRRRLEWGPGAEEVYFAFSRKMDEWDDRDAQRAEVGRRVCENAVRLATNVAVGCGSAKVDREDIEWATKLMEHSFEAACGGMSKYMHEYLDFPKFRDKVLEAIPPGTFVPKEKLFRAFGRSMKWGNELERALKQLLAENRIREALGPKPTRGPSPKGYEQIEEAEE